MYRLYDVIHTEKKLTLVFEYLDQDLKKYLDECSGVIAKPTIKVFTPTHINTLDYVLNTYHSLFFNNC